MSAEAINHVWRVDGVTPEEKLALIFLANNTGGLGQPYSPDWHELGLFICGDYWRAAKVLTSLIAKGLVVEREMPDTGGTLFFIAYDGEYYDPIDWYNEPRGRSRRVIALIERDGPRCTYCGTTPVNYEVDHFIPRARGGEDKMSNLVLACPPCNRVKSAKHPKDFMGQKRYEDIACALMVVSGE